MVTNYLALLLPGGARKRAAHSEDFIPGFLPLPLEEEVAMQQQQQQYTTITATTTASVFLKDAEVLLTEGWCNFLDLSDVEEGAPISPLSNDTPISPLSDAADDHSLALAGDDDDWSAFL